MVTINIKQHDKQYHPGVGGTRTDTQLGQNKIFRRQRLVGDKVSYSVLAVRCCSSMLIVVLCMTLNFKLAQTLSHGSWQDDSCAVLERNYVQILSRKSILKDAFMSSSISSVAVKQSEGSLRPFFPPGVPSSAFLHLIFWHLRRPLLHSVDGHLRERYVDTLAGCCSFIFHKAKSFSFLFKVCS